MRLPRKWLLALAVSAAVPQAGWADSPAPQNTPTVSPASSDGSIRPNKAIAQEIAATLKSAGLTGRNIQIRVKDGIAHIGGQIGDAGQKSTVTQLVNEIDGVVSVDNRMTPMQTSAEPANPIQTAGFEKTAETPFGVQTVAHEPSAAPMAPAAGNEPAALPPSVEQALPVATTPQAAPTPAPSPAKRSNQAVAQDIAKALSSVGLNRYDLEIRYKNGLCSLIGAVQHPAEAAQAAMICSHIDGVENVSNQLTVNGRPSQPMIEAAYAEAQQRMQAMQAGQQAPQAQQFAAAPQDPRFAAPQGQPMPGYGPRGPIQQTAAQAPYGPGYGAPQGQPIQPVGHHANPGVYNRPALPNHAWPSYAPYDNYAAVTYPGQYDASAFPYIGPFYPYPQVPLGWRKAQLEWDDGYWNLDFDSRTDKWWWFVNPANWK